MNLPKRKLIRLSGYDYSQFGYYYITICTQNRKCLFGNIIDNKMVLNNIGIGKMIKNNWEFLPKYFPVGLDEYQIMPNHIHSIINIVGAGLSRPTLGQIIAYFKYQTTKQINARYQTGAKTAPLQEFNKIWQRNYYEHVVRNESELLKIREYVKLNPQIWERDRNNPIKNL